jgi:glutamate decarboxylase
MPIFEVISDGSAIPVVSFRLKQDVGYTVFDISALLRSYGWQVPAYTMPDDATDIAVLRIVVREGLSANLARALRDDLVECLGKLDKIKVGGFATEAHFAH